MDSTLTKERNLFSFQFKTMSQRGFFLLQFALRVLTAVLAAVAMIIMLTNRQSIYIFTIEMKARYYYSSAFKFMVGADAAVCACSVISLILVFLQSRGSKSNPNHYFLLFLHDLAMTTLMVAGCAAATAIGVVGRYGQIESGWEPFCDRMDKFCARATLSIALSYSAWVCYLVLTVMSVRKLKSWATQINCHQPQELDEIRGNLSTI